MNKKETKRTLLVSVMALLLCSTMLIGSTFAWFTDTAATSVNRIEAGRLQIDIIDAEGASIDGGTLNWKKAAGHENETILWEPNCTYELGSFQVVNNGNLALKYKISISGATGDTELLDVLEWTYQIGESPYDMNAEHSLAAQGKDGDKSGLITISAHMLPTAGNHYQGMAIDNISITVYATQDTVEYDSTGNTYDENAVYPVANMSELKESLANGGIVAVDNDIATNNEDTLDARMIISQPTTLNLKGKIKSPDNMGNNSTNFTALIVAADTTINAGENGGIDTGINGGYAINILNGATLTINGGNYYGGGTAVQVQKGTLIINGGIFAVEPYDNPVYGYKYVLNCIDSALRNGTAKIIVNGGTFINYDPSHSNSENPMENFVADGYKVVSETKENGDIWYSVVKE